MLMLLALWEFLELEIDTLSRSILFYLSLFLEKNQGWGAESK